jgi:circadian clock protein KaiC
MTVSRKVALENLPSGIAKLDDVLGGGLPEYSFNIIAGEPGCGKTTLAHQILFANASEERPAIYFTVLGEPSLKMLRYQQQFSFFDASKVNRSIHFVNLSEDALSGDLGHVLDTIVRKVEEIGAAFVVVDSFRTLVRARDASKTGGMELEEFVQRLSLQLTSWQATTFLIGEYGTSEIRENPIFTTADGIICLYQSVSRNSMVRKLQVFKMRGQSPQPGMHTLRITDHGMQVFPRMLKPIEEEPSMPPSTRMISIGVPALDEMLGGGTFAGSAVMIAGPSGSGKTTVAIQFIAEGALRGERGVIAIFEETATKYVSQAMGFGVNLQRLVDEGTVAVVYMRPLDLSVDETLYAIQEAVDRLGAKRVVIDSISGLEAALAPTFKEDFRESLYRLLGALTGVEITVLMTVENTDSYQELRFTPHAVSFLAHDIVLQRYAELHGKLGSLLTIIKTRGRPHSREIRPYEVGPQGLIIGDAMPQYHALLGGTPEQRPPTRSNDGARYGLTDQESMLLDLLEEGDGISIDELRKRTGLQRARLAQGLERLVSLEHARKVTAKGRSLYRPTRPRSRS